MAAAGKEPALPRKFSDDDQSRQYVEAGRSAFWPLLQRSPVRSNAAKLVGEKANGLIIGDGRGRQLD
ncbi:MULTISPECIES: hypothetical protein [unclassified Bradyrhizobium]|uniref:hypothetical protein n=1 Tax=unclassified Bradyrhizobium TaxID=2631580 RepID=UPI0004041F50|nr:MULTISPECIES: hypothetical protein [unclassified Bradyrhizobium]QIG97375.1 hypothetical protein G6P99_36675 [Bradyrhizobium sp. 6(2017)]